MLAQHTVSTEVETAQRAPRIRVAAIVMRNDELLVVRHVKNDRDYWLLPGGGIEYGESLTDALKRELIEEACVQIEIGNLVIVNDTIPPGNTRHTVNLCFTAKIVGGSLKRGIDPRVVEVRFMPVRDLCSLTFYPDIRHELIPAIKAGFPNKASYLGNLWKD